MAIFTEYDSSNFATIGESITHSKQNPFTVDKFGTTILFGNGNKLTSPNSNIKSLLNNLDGLYINRNLTEAEYYRPETTAKLIYGSVDFWFLIMLINNFGTILDYIQPTIKVLPENELYRIEKLFSVTNTITLVNNPPIYR